MKVRIEFSQPDSSQDLESSYDAVEFTTVYAGSIDGWAEAVIDFLKPAEWSCIPILLSALFKSGASLSPNGYFVKENIDSIRDLRDELTLLIESVEQQPEKSTTATPD
jgi:hypothetical protein